MVERSKDGQMTGTLSVNDKLQQARGSGKISGIRILSSSDDIQCTEAAAAAAAAGSYIIHCARPNQCPAGEALKLSTTSQWPT